MSDQEERVSLLLRNIEDEFSAFDKLDDLGRKESKLRTITGLLRDVKAYAPAFDCCCSEDLVPCWWQHGQWRCTAHSWLSSDCCAALHAPLVCTSLFIQKRQY